MNYGHLLMEDMEKINVTSVNRLLILGESNSLNATMVKNWKGKYLESTAHAQTWTMNVTLDITELRMADVLLIVKIQPRGILMDSPRTKNNNVKHMAFILNLRDIEEFQVINVKAASN
jgi:hypothetical protein